MTTPLRNSICSLLCLSSFPAVAATITWSTSPAVNTTEVNNLGVQIFGYAFSSLTGTATLNGATFTYLNNEGLPMSAANAQTPGFQRFLDTATSHTETNDLFYQGPNTQLAQIMDGLTWGGNTQFQLNNLTPGTNYLFQIFSSDDRIDFINRVADYDSSWTTPDGSRQLENIDYTAGGPWTDPATRFKIFTGTFTADAPTQQILTNISGEAGQIDLNAIQLRVVVPEPGSGSLLVGAFSLAGTLRRRRLDAPART